MIYVRLDRLKIMFVVKLQEVIQNELKIFEWTAIINSVKI